MPAKVVTVARVMTSRLPWVGSVSTRRALSAARASAASTGSARCSSDGSPRPTARSTPRAQRRHHAGQVERTLTAVAAAVDGVLEQGARLLPGLLDEAQAVVQRAHVGPGEELDAQPGADPVGLRGQLGELRGPVRTVPRLVLAVGSP